jgi:hypothetical protein
MTYFFQSRWLGRFSIRIGVAFGIQGKCKVKSVAIAAPKTPLVIPNAVRNQVGREEAVFEALEWACHLYLPLQH